MNSPKLEATEGGYPIIGVSPGISHASIVARNEAEIRKRFSMNKTVFFGALTVAGLAAGVAAAGTMDDVKARGKLNCGVTTGLSALPHLTQMGSGKDLT